MCINYCCCNSRRASSCCDAFTCVFDSKVDGTEEFSEKNARM